MKIMFFLRIRTFYLCDLNIALSLKMNSENDSKKRVKKNQKSNRHFSSRNITVEILK